MDRVGHELGRPAPLHLAVVRSRCFVRIQPMWLQTKPSFGVCRSSPGLVGLRVVHAVHRHPGDRAALAREHARERAEVLERLREPEAAVRQQAVVRQADPDRAGQPPEDEREPEARPGERPGREQRARVDRAEPADVDPVEALAVPGQWSTQASSDGPTGRSESQASRSGDGRIVRLASHQRADAARGRTSAQAGRARG